MIQRILIALILLYRRFLSGRLRGTRCSFTDDETCSAFGLRVTRTARSAREAIGRIARRLRRCSDACLLSDGTRLGWSELHDENPTAIAAAMRADGEGEAAIARMLQTRLVVARWCGDRDSFEACRAALRGVRSERPRVVSLPMLVERSRARVARSVGLTVFAVAFASALPVVMLPVALAAAVSVGQRWIRMARYKQQRLFIYAASRGDPPVPDGMRQRRFESA